MEDSRVALVLGGGGMLARELVPALRVAGWACLSIPIERCDITRPSDVRSVIEDHHASLVVNAAAYTAVDRAETDEAAATRVNGDGPGILADVAAALNATLVHVSTDYVFDGAKRAPYTEDDIPRPLGAYARSKLRGEERVLASGARAFIVRTGELYGDGPNFFDAIFARAKSNRPLRVVTDQMVSPTWTREVAMQIATTVLHAPPGVYHATADGEVSWFEAATVGLRIVGLSPEIVGVTTDEYASPTPRPRYSVLSHGKLARLGLYRMRPWRDALADWLGSRDV